MKTEYESPYLPPLGSEQFPDFITSRTGEVIIGYQALADIIEWNLLYSELNIQQQDELLSKLHQVKSLIAYFEDEAEQLRRLFNKPELFSGFYQMTIQMRKTTPLKPRNNLFKEFIKRVRKN
jgi:hypothetical protein